MREYKGIRTEEECTVTVDGKPLNLRLDLRGHSPTGAEWGYAGSGPAQLALAIVADHLRDDGRALEIYQTFKFRVVGRLPHESWTLTEREVAAAVAAITGQAANGSRSEDQ